MNLQRKLGMKQKRNAIKLEKRNMQSIKESPKTKYWKYSKNFFAKDKTMTTNF